ncbi:lipopolysaccharide biosynthesis protein [Shewanella algae]|nr:lipopolysaccharide biosynthesis protein [Shewanella algae]AYV13198.1 lipopolysaccharide biosynthesis protein [Shewanella algae]MBO2594661.1 lipopolysaccharide biosynthesis protein [Shewanella algae]MBO2666017.1 lipopolysaccharide biosynthesis protein [Shewanella algae]MBO2678686.1 lipopolysaccharide biosynthesis protein [Shewanella algae]
MTIFNQKFLSGIAWGFLDKIINQFALLAVSIYLANKLGPEVFGLLGILSIFLLISESIVTSGLGQALIQQSNSVKSIQYSTVFISNIALALVIYVVLYVMSTYISAYYKLDELAPASRLLFIVIVINSISVVDRSKLAIDLDFKSIAKASFIGNFAGCSFAIIMVNIGYDDDYIPLVSMAIVRALITTLFLRFYSKLRFKLIFDVDEFKPLFNFGYKILIAGLISAVSNNIYTLIVGKIFDTKSVGYYSQSANLTNTLSGSITSIVQGVSFPVMTEVKNETQKLKNLYIKLIRCTMLIVFPIMIGFASVADNFVSLFLGNEWMPIISLLIVLSVSRIFTPVSAINMNVLNAIGRSDLYLRVDLIKLPLSLVIIVLGSIQGVYYLAVGNLITTIIAFGINAYYPGRLLGIGLAFQLKAMFKPALASLFMVMIVLLVNVDSLFVELMLKIIFGVFAYIFGLILLKEGELNELYRFVFSKVVRR